MFIPLNSLRAFILALVRVTVFGANVAILRRLKMKVGSLVRTNGHPHADQSYPKGLGVVMDYRDEGLNEMYNTVYVMWLDNGEYRSIRHIFLEVISEGR
jgi:hypothetical protein